MSAMFARKMASEAQSGIFGAFQSFQTNYLSWHRIVRGEKRRKGLEPRREVLAAELTGGGDAFFSHADALRVCGAF